MSLESQTKLQYWLAKQNFNIGWPNKTFILVGQTKLLYWLAKQNFYIGWPNKTSIQVIICISDNKLYTNLHIMFPLQKKSMFI